MEGILKEKASTSLSGRVGEGDFSAKGTLEKREIRNWQKLGMIKMRDFFLEIQQGPKS